jgi:cholest-4-en-3-one 26-monooxygenase
MARVISEGFDLTDPDILADRLPLDEYAYLREHAPVFWNAQAPDVSGHDDGGFWALTRYDDVKAVSIARKGWSVEENSAFVRLLDQSDVAKDTTKELLLCMDPPRHTRVRGVANRCFTPRAVATLEDDLRDRAARIVWSAARREAGDFVADVACHLPLQAIAGLMGFPDEDRERLIHWSDQMAGTEDPEYGTMDQTATFELLAYAYASAEVRKARDLGDVTSRLVRPDATGQTLSSEEYGFFFMILAVAGNETTRQAIAHGMLAFLEHPDQWELWREERPATAVDEILRYASPAVVLQRTATEDTEVGGHAIRAGERVGMYFASANFDEGVYKDPRRFDIGRSPNPHVTFGGGGQHFCIGANLTKLEVRIMFDALADALPDIKLLGTPRRLRSSWLNGIKALPVSYGTRAGS